MAQPKRNVKAESAGPNRRPTFVVIWVTRCQSWLDAHPRTAWYFAALLALNYVIDLLQSTF